MRTSALNVRPFLVVRHGETNWNKEGLFQGRSEIALNDAGKEQVRNSSKIMRKQFVSKVLVSPLNRALETATLLFENQACEIEVENALVECDFGSFEGRSIVEVMNERSITKKEQLAEILPDDAEQWDSVLRRGRIIVDRIVELQSANHGVALVAHDAVLQALSEVLIGCWFDAVNGKIYEFNPASRSWTEII